jgi:hypothetical protein
LTAGETADIQHFDALRDYDFGKSAEKAFDRNAGKIHQKMVINAEDAISVLNRNFLEIGLVEGKRIQLLNPGWQTNRWQGRTVHKCISLDL